jgi:hypothetical protein
MKTKLIFSTETKDIEQWIDMPFVPRINEWINLVDILKKEELEAIVKSARCWSGMKGTVMTVEYRHGDNDYYAEIYVWCED